jgi:hypothetical protein
MKKRIDWAEANAACEALTESEDSLTREIVMRLAEKWRLGHGRACRSKRSYALFANDGAGGGRQPEVAHEGAAAAGAMCW